MAAVLSLARSSSALGSGTRAVRGDATSEGGSGLVVAEHPGGPPIAIGEGQRVARVQTQEHVLKREFSPVLRPPVWSSLEYAFDVRQQWEGVVTKVEGDEFTVVLRDVRNSDAPEYEAVLPIEEVADDDLPLLVPGGVLYWTIGYEQTRTGQRKRVSTIRLRRLPAWSRGDMARVEQRARALDGLFRDE
jgi:hypothetical protein